MSWRDILKNSGFTIWAKNEDFDLDQDWQILATKETREAAFELVSSEADKIGREVLGSASEGKIQEMSGVFSVGWGILYVIQPENEKAPPKNYHPNLSETYTGKGKLNQMEGNYEIAERYKED